MKKVLSLLSVFLLWSLILTHAQEKNMWFDAQIIESIGLNSWNKLEFASDRLPRLSSTDLRATLNMYIFRPVGLFGDLAVGIMPAPRNGLSDPAARASLYAGIPYYTKELTIEEGYQTATIHYKLTVGLFGKIPANEKLSVFPYFGIGMMSISPPTCEAILKEQDSNMQYTASYQWFKKDSYGNGSSVATLGYLAGRLRFAYHISPKFDLLFGLEYTWHFTRADFFETYTNYFNHNLVKTNQHKGNQVNMLGLSLGISFL